MKPLQHLADDWPALEPLLDEVLEQPTAARAAWLASRTGLAQPLREALGYAAPPAPLERISHAALRARGRLLRRFPARMSVQSVADLRWVRSYPDGYDVEQLGSFPVPGVGACPVRHEDRQPA